MRVAAGLVLVAGIGYAGRDGMGFSARENSGVAASAVPAVPAAEMTAESGATDSATRETAVSTASQAANAAARATPRAAAPAPARVAATTPAPRRDAEAAVPPPAALEAVVGAAAAATDSRARAELSAVVVDSIGALQRARRAEQERRFGSESRLEQVVVTGVQERTAKQPTEQQSPPATPPASAPAVTLAAPSAAQKAAALQDAAASAAASGAGARSSLALAQVGPAFIGVIPGCWRTTTTGVSDSLLTSVPILRQLGDTLVVRVTADGAEAKVIRGRTTALGVSSLVGRATSEEGEMVSFLAELVACRR